MQSSRFAVVATALVGAALLAAGTASAATMIASDGDPIGDAFLSRGVITDPDIPFTASSSGGDSEQVVEWVEALLGLEVLSSFRDEGTNLGSALDCSTSCNTSPSQSFDFTHFVVKAGTYFFAFENNGDDYAHYSLDIPQGTSNITYVSTVPVPAALPLFAAGVAGLAWMRRRRTA